MNADELDAAREAVSATRTWRNQMRADWGTSFREPEEVLDEAVGELIAERDRLRAVVDALRPIAETVVAAGNPNDLPYAEGNLAAWRFVLWQLDVSPDTGG